jgi:hypothetical protein
LKFFTLLATTIFFIGCATTNSNIDTEASGISENDKIAVCGEVAGEKQTYPTLGDLHNDGAVFKYYGPCYDE